MRPARKTSKVGRFSAKQEAINRVHLAAIDVTDHRASAELPRKRTMTYSVGAYAGRRCVGYRNDSGEVRRFEPVNARLTECGRGCSLQFGLRRICYIGSGVGRKGVLVLGFRFAGRGYKYDDVGRLNSFRLSSEHRLTEAVTLRGSWGPDRATRLTPWLSFTTPHRRTTPISCAIPGPLTWCPVPRYRRRIPTGRARDHGQPAAQALRHQKARRWCRVPHASTSRGCGMVPPVAFRPVKSAQRQLGDAKPSRVRARRVYELHQARRRRHHDLRQLHQHLGHQSG